MLDHILGLLLVATSTNAVSLDTEAKCETSAKASVKGQISSNISAGGEISLNTSTEGEMGGEQYMMMPAYGTSPTYGGTPQQNMSYRDYAFYYKNGYTRHD